jgi:hypothetical protein
MIITLCHLASPGPMTWSATVRPPSKFHGISKTSGLTVKERINSRPITMKFQKASTLLLPGIRFVLLLYWLCRCGRFRESERNVTPVPEDLRLSKLAQTQYLKERLAQRNCNYGCHVSKGTTGSAIIASTSTTILDIPLHFTQRFLIVDHGPRVT